MKMVGLPLACGNGMDVEIEDLVAGELEIGQPRFLAALSQGCFRRHLMAFEMPAHLQPTPEAAMVMEQELPFGRIDDETARRDMSGHEMVTRERARRPCQQPDDRLVMARLEPIGRPVPAKLAEQPFVTHHRSLTVARGAEGSG